MVLAMIGACMLAMAGCGEAAPEEPISTSTIVLAADGSFTQYRVENFDREYYQLSELDSMIRQEVQNFLSGKPQQNAGGVQAVSVEQVGHVEGSSGQVMVALRFMDSQVYEDYQAQVDQQPRELFYGTVRDALAQGYDLAGVLLDAQKGTVITAQQLEKSAERRILIFEDAVQIRCPSKVLYCSGNVSLTDAGYVDASGEGMKYVLMK